MLLGKKDRVIRIGNLESTRDITDVRDVVQAYKMLLEQGKSGEIYNVCTGHEIKTRGLLEKLIEKSGLEIKIEEDENLVRGNEQQRVCGSFKKLNKEVGWKPEIPIDQTLIDMIEYWKQSLAEGVA